MARLRTFLQQGIATYVVISRGLDDLKGDENVQCSEAKQEVIAQMSKIQLRITVVYVETSWGNSTNIVFDKLHCQHIEVDIVFFSDFFSS